MLFRFRIISAAITPGIHPASVRRKTIKAEPHPLSITDNGGNKIASITLINDIVLKNTKKILEKQFQVSLTCQIRTQPKYASGTNEAGRYFPGNIEK